MQKLSLGVCDGGSYFGDFNSQDLANTNSGICDDDVLASLPSPVGTAPARVHGAVRVRSAPARSSAIWSGVFNYFLHFCYVLAFFS